MGFGDASVKVGSSTDRWGRKATTHASPALSLPPASPAPRAPERLTLGLNPFSRFHTPS